MLFRSQSPFVGGKDHTTHHLVYLGFSDRKVALIFGGISALSMAFIVLITEFIEVWNYLYFGLFVAYFVTVFSVMFGCTHAKKARESIDQNEGRIFILEKQQTA